MKSFANTYLTWIIDYIPSPILTLANVVIWIINTCLDDLDWAADSLLLWVTGMGAKNDSGKHSDAWGYEGSAFQKFVLSFADDQ